MSVMLYKHPGPHAIHGDMFDYVIVDEDDVDGAIADGWARTTAEAKGGVTQPPAGDVDALRALAAGDKRRKDVREAIATLEEMGHDVD